MTRGFQVRVGVALVALALGGGCLCRVPPGPEAKPPSTPTPTGTQGVAVDPMPSPMPPELPRDHGLVFVESDPHLRVKRRFDQRFEIAVRNEGTAPQPLRLALQNPHDFLQADFVGPGSRDSEEQPPMVAPGETWTAVLVVHAPAAPPGEVSMAIQLMEDGPGGMRTNYRSARLRVEVLHEDFVVDAEVKDADPATLARRVTIRNNGAALEDLDLVLEGELAGTASIEPTVRHARLASGSSLAITVRPGLVPGFAGIRGELVARTAAGVARWPLAFDPPHGTRLLLARGGSVTTASSQTRYCTNVGRGQTPMGGPSQPGPGPTPRGGGGGAQLGPAWRTTGTGFEGGRELGRYPPARRPPPSPSPEPSPTPEPSPAPARPGDTPTPTPNPGRSVLAPPPPVEIPPLPPVPTGDLVNETPRVDRRAPRPVIPVGVLSRVRRAPLAIGGARGVSSPLGTAPGDPGRPAVSSGDHGVDLLWSEDDARGARALVYSQLARDGRGVRPPVRLTRPGVLPEDATVATAASGRILAAWVADGRIHFRSSEDRGATWAEARELPGFSGEIQGLRLAAAAGYQWVAWVEEGVEAHVFLARRPEGGRDFRITRVPAPGLEVRSLRGLHVDGAGAPSLLVATEEGSALLRDGEEPESLPGPARLSQNHGEPGWLGLWGGSEVRLRSLVGTGMSVVPLGGRSLPEDGWDLEVGEGGPWVRLHPADGGHWKLTPEEALRLPSRDAGATAALLAFEIKTPWDSRTYRRHRLEVAVNGAPVLTMDEVVPQGRFLVPLPPHQLRWDQLGRPVNLVEVASKKLNPGHYYNLEAFRLHVRSPAREAFVFAADQAAADAWLGDQEGVNHGTEDLALGLATDFMLPPKAPALLALPLVVANRGDSASAPTRLQILANEALVADVSVSSLEPLAHRTLEVPVPLPPDATGLRVLLEAPGDPEDDTIELFFTSPGRPDPAAPARLPARRPPFPNLAAVAPGRRVAVQLSEPGARRAYRIPGAVAATLAVELSDVPPPLSPDVVLYRPDGRRLDPGPDGNYPTPEGPLVAVIADAAPDAADPGEFYATFTWQEAP